MITTETEQTDMEIAEEIADLANRIGAICEGKKVSTCINAMFVVLRSSILSIPPELNQMDLVESTIRRMLDKIFDEKHYQIAARRVTLQ